MAPFFLYLLIVECILEAPKKNEVQKTRRDNRKSPSSPDIVAVSVAAAAAAVHKPTAVHRRLSGVNCTAVVT